jgi:hypothetical protein
VKSRTYFVRRPSYFTCFAESFTCSTQLTVCSDGEGLSLARQGVHGNVGSTPSLAREVRRLPAEPASGYFARFIPARAERHSGSVHRRVCGERVSATSSGVFIACPRGVGSARCFPRFLPRPFPPSSGSPVSRLECLTPRSSRRSAPPVTSSQLALDPSTSTILRAARSRVSGFVPCPNSDPPGIGVPLAHVVGEPSLAK